MLPKTEWGEKRKKKKNKEDKVFLYGPKPLQLSLPWTFLRLAAFIYSIFFRTKRNKTNCLVKHPLIISRLLVLLNETLGTHREAGEDGLRVWRLPTHARCHPASSRRQVCSAGLWMPNRCDGKAACWINLPSTRLTSSEYMCICIYRHFTHRAPIYIYICV